VAQDETRTSALEESSGSRGRVLAFWEGGHAACGLGGESEVVIGRASSANLRIDHTTVSREHARLTMGASVTVTDLGSSNGTKVAGRQLTPHQPEAVQPDELIEIGGAYLVLELPEVRAADKSRVDNLIARVAGSDLCVLLLGETGVGKDVAANRIHGLSPRCQAPLVKINCATLGDNLLESELFGHERGAFTGAVAAKPGLLEIARGGSVFLDEVAESSLPIQAKLLRAIEQREIRRVGGVEARPIDVRFIAATNRPLDQMVAAGTFRRDLYFRLAGMTIRLPPLRKRQLEFAGLTEDLLRAACERQGRQQLTLSNRAFALLRKHPFPGNVRELKNLLERAVVLADGARIEPEHLLFDAPGGNDGVELNSERERIANALEQSGGNQSRAAELLGISRRTLVNRLNEFGFPRPRKR
jgi:transcriptional regulator with PAS, ATPase and Fis domain